MTYVISDLHGLPLEQFLQLLQKVNFSERDSLFVLGDVIDRGWDGIRILHWLQTQQNCYFILGNHEALMLSCEFYFDENRSTTQTELTPSEAEALENWRDNSGWKTIEALYAETPKARRCIFDYLRNAPLWRRLRIDEKEFLFTHSGLGEFDVSKQLKDYSREQLLWNRPSISDRYFDNIITICGHTPTLFYGDEYFGKPLVTDTWINIDTGVSFGLPPAMLRLEDMRCFI